MMITDASPMEWAALFIAALLWIAGGVFIWASRYDRGYHDGYLDAMNEAWEMASEWIDEDDLDEWLDEISKSDIDEIDKMLAMPPLHTLEEDDWELDPDALADWTWDARGEDDPGDGESGQPARA